MEYTFSDRINEMKNERLVIRRAFHASVILLDVAPLCETDTARGPENYEASLRYWLKVREYDGTETPESLAAEWDAKS